MCLDYNILSLRLREKVSSKRWAIRSGAPEGGLGCADKLGRHQPGDELQPQDRQGEVQCRERETRWPALTAEGRQRPGAAWTGVAVTH